MFAIILLAVREFRAQTEGHSEGNTYYSASLDICTETRLRPSFFWVETPHEWVVGFLHIKRTHYLHLLESEISVIRTTRQLKKRQYVASNRREAITLWRGFLSQKNKVFRHLRGTFPIREMRLLDSSWLSVTAQVINAAPNTRFFVKSNILSKPVDEIQVWLSRTNYPALYSEISTYFTLLRAV